MTGQRQRQEQTSVINNYVDLAPQDTFHRMPTHLEHNRYEAAASRASTRTKNQSRNQESATGKPFTAESHISVLPTELVPPPDAQETASDILTYKKKDKFDPKVTQKLLVSKLVFDQKSKEFRCTKSQEGRTPNRQGRELKSRQTPKSRSRLTPAGRATPGMRQSKARKTSGRKRVVIKEKESGSSIESFSSFNSGRRDQERARQKGLTEEEKAQQRIDLYKGKFDWNYMEINLAKVFKIKGTIS